MPLVLLGPDDPWSTPDVGTVEMCLLNNLSDAGLESGERQITDLLRDLAGPLTVRLRLASLPSIARGAAARARIAARYTDVGALLRQRIDGLIVTGCEPSRDRLPDEAFWHELTAVIDWAEHNTRSAVWSCLAAHAAVLHLDGIERRRLPAKCTGSFEIDRAAGHDRAEGHALLAGLPDHAQVAHSRWNDLGRDELEAAGYQILTSSAEVGVDTFVKSWRSLFVYLQGHPEYDGDALRREYRRDVVRFLERTSDTYPVLPQHYFDAATARRLSAFAGRARRERDPALLADMPLERRGPIWHRDVAKTLFRNWLNLLTATAPRHVA